ncbi:MAG TPA: glycine cleavage system protein GcvH [Thermoanaerobaculia bacterium]|jgi:glycine cleavage system H protein
MVSVPENFRYAKSHEYVDVEGDVGTIGISDYAQSELGDVVFVELPQPGSHVEVGEQFGSIESVKAVSELFSPVTGEVIEINETLADNPALVNTDPHGDGWLLKVRLSDVTEAEELMPADEYQEFLEKEAGH